MRAARLGWTLGLLWALPFGQASATALDMHMADNTQAHAPDAAYVDPLASIAAHNTDFTNTASAPSQRPQSHWWLSPGGKAYHVNRKKNYNEENFGLGLEYGNFESSWQVGFYRNSHRKDSYYAMYAWRPFTLDQAGHWRVGAVAGLVSGYRNRYFHDVMPLVMPTLAAEYRHVGVSFYATPKISGLSPAMLMLHLRFRL